MFVKLKGAVRYRACVSGHPAFLLSPGFDHERNTRRGFSDDDHLRAAAQWLASAQDSQADGGVAGRYRLDRGWTSSYPETTGYIVPTLRTATYSHKSQYRGIYRSNLLFQKIAVAFRIILNVFVSRA